MLKIAICDDEQPIREYLKRLVENVRRGKSDCLSTAENCWRIRRRLT